VKVALYARVSTSDQNCAMQLEELQQYCLRAGWLIFDRYVDAAWSGMSRKRPEHARLMQDVSMRRFNAVLVWKLDRFGRSVIDVLQQLAVLESNQVRFLAVSQGIDTDQSSPTGRLQLNILAAVAEFERELISERVRAGVAQAKREGREIGRPRRVIDSRRASELRAEGRSWNEIARALGVGMGTARRAALSFSKNQASGGLPEVVQTAHQVHS
jgi:putative DNA-invertase from lambdoid prophage Rac